MKPKALLKLTEAAATRIRSIYATRVDSTVYLYNKPQILLKLGLENKGCLGTGYKLSFIKYKDRAPTDELIEHSGIKFMVDGKSFMYLVGTTIDYVEDELDSKFVYLNPNVNVSLGVSSIGNMQMWCKLYSEYFFYLIIVS